MLKGCHFASLDRTTLPEPAVPEELLAPFDRINSSMGLAAINFEPLVNLRFAHQREQARTGVRKYHLEGMTPGEDSSAQLMEITTKPEPTVYQTEITPRVQLYYPQP